MGTAVGGEEKKKVLDQQEHNRGQEEEKQMMMKNKKKRWVVVVLLIRTTMIACDCFAVCSFCKQVRNYLYILFKYIYSIYICIYLSEGADWFVCLVALYIFYYCDCNCGWMVLLYLPCTVPGTVLF